MPGLLDHLLFLTLALLGPLGAARLGYRRLMRAGADQRPRVRLQVYRGAIALQWALTLVLAVLWLALGRPWSRLGLAPRWTGGLIGVLAGAALTIGFVVRQRRQVMRDDEALVEVRERMRHVEPMLPRSPREMRAFAALALTAGICEELLYRGFMIQYLANFTNIYVAIALAAVIFGLGHAYQGVRGVGLTTAVGAFLGAVYYLTGSLYAGMLLHALMDLHSGHLAYVALRRTPPPVMDEPGPSASLEALAAAPEADVLPEPFTPAPESESEPPLDATEAR